MVEYHPLKYLENKDRLIIDELLLLPGIGLVYKVCSGTWRGIWFVRTGFSETFIYKEKCGKFNKYLIFLQVVWNQDKLQRIPMVLIHKTKEQVMLKM